MQNSCTRFILAIVPIALLLVSSFHVLAQQSDSDLALKQLGEWLQLDVEKRGDISKQKFANVKIDKAAAVRVRDMLWMDYSNRNAQERKKEWKDKVIELDGMKMKFDYKVFGPQPKNGRSLFISMHGGGGAPPRVNESQWKNQIRLYQPPEGVYLAPRAPTDTWNLWHQSHIDKFFERIIQDATFLESVNPNRVFLMGYSAGGDGVYQLAPRMADSLAAAAMMAGHPNDASPLGLRNIGFTIYMGGKDSAYNRNKIAAQWKEKLEALKAEDPQGYAHKVVIFEEFGHWMKNKDAAAIPWMMKFERNPRPDRVVWKQSSTTHDQFYWLSVDDDNKKKGSEIVVSRIGQQVNIEKADGVKTFNLELNDQIVDLDRPIQVNWNGKPLQNPKMDRSIGVAYESLQKRGDYEYIYFARLPVTIPNIDQGN